MNIDWVATQTCQSYVGSILRSIPPSLCKMRKSKLLLVVYII